MPACLNQLLGQDQMNALNKFLSLFHKKQRMTPQYQNLSKLKRILFMGSVGFVLCLSFSKFLFTNLTYSFEPTEQNKYLIKLNPALDKGEYKPTAFLIFGIFQRLCAKYVEEEPYLNIREEQYEGQVLHWVALHDKATFNKSQTKKKQIPVALVIAGSEGFDNTFKHCMSAIYNLGFRTIAIDPRDVHDQDKMHQIVKHIKQMYPSSKLFGLGVQYGANLLINYASEHPKTFHGLVSIANPFDLLKSQINLQNSWIWKPLYYSVLNGRLQKARQLNKNFKKDSIASLFQLDKILYNIDDEHFLEWKGKNSCINSISKLQDTTLFLQSKEDPFTQPIGNDERFQNEHCIYITTARGGHNEWFQNLWMNRWFTNPIKHFLKLQNQQTVTKMLSRIKEKQKNNPSNAL